jgi:hypothetical protein
MEPHFVRFYSSLKRGRLQPNNTISVYSFFIGRSFLAPTPMSGPFCVHYGNGLHRDTSPGSNQPVASYLAHPLLSCAYVRSAALLFAGTSYKNVYERRVNSAELPICAQERKTLCRQQENPDTRVIPGRFFASVR